MSYTVCSGYHEGERRLSFYDDLWLPNVLTHTQLSQIIIIADDGAHTGNFIEGRGVEHLSLNGNLGHIGDLIHGNKPKHQFVGWSATVMALAMLCYQNETDMVYQEQDCLTFGDCIETMYKEIGDGKVIFGKSKLMPCSQSLFLVKHDYLPQFVADYLGVGPDTEKGFYTEEHFALLRQRKPKQWRQFSFGVDRERPNGWADQRPMYVQQLKETELDMLAEKGMIQR
jgi:hypothetical protein